MNTQIELSHEKLIRLPEVIDLMHEIEEGFIKKFEELEYRFDAIETCIDDLTYHLKNMRNEG